VLRPKDETNTNTLPDPEQNPLLNPLLAAHMGRWAEVYFTNPPEKRGEAIAQLIRELESMPPPESAKVQAIHSVQATHDEREEERAETVEVEDTSRPAELVRTCSACAYENAAEQNYCGMCGASLQVLPEEHLPQVAEVVPREAAREGESEHESQSPFSADISADISPGPVERAMEPGFRSTNDLTAPADPMEGDLHSFGIEPEPVSHRYRLYVGVAVAILLVALVYMAWRSTKTISGPAVSQPVPAKTISAAPPAAPITGVSAQQPTAGPSSSSGRDASPVPGKRQPEETPRGNPSAKLRPASHAVASAPNSGATAVEPSSAEDLATAENYLNGTHGTTRDSKEAALWLWKAVGKGNATATLALSDLYLRGDGVPKNCDQARLLLDAAARKGVRTAAERLRNLQAFGCE
jgi:hypothetical protein